MKWINERLYNLDGQDVARFKVFPKINGWSNLKDHRVSHKNVEIDMEVILDELERPQCE